MPDAPRVLQLLGPSTGGIRRHVSFLTGQLRADGHRVEVAGPAGVLDVLDLVVPVPSGFGVADARASRRALAGALPEFDLVHAHGLKAGWLASLARGATSPPLVLSVHNLVLREAAGISTPLLRVLERRLPGRMDRTIAVSEQVARRFEGAAGADRIEVIPPAGPTPSPTKGRDEVRRELGVGPDDDLIVTPARLHPQKDIGLLLDAAELVREKRPTVRWFVFGEGPLRDDLERDIARRGLGGVVTLAGQRPTVDDELAAADVVAVTSRWESGPLVVLEALALHRPVVSTRVGLAPDVLAPPGGRLVDVGDASGFADALIAVLGGGSAASSMVPEGLDPVSLARRVAATYDEVLASHGRRP